MRFDRGRMRWLRRAVPAAAVVVAAAASFGCQTARDAASTAAYELNPFASTDLAVHAASVHGSYLVADVAGRQERVRFLAPASEACARVLQPEARVRYAKSGVFGRLSREGDEACDVTGVASLEEWRDRQPRPRLTSMVPRATARWEPLFADERWIFVRGRFPLASKVGIPAGYDLVAMLPADAVCREAAARGEATIEFRQAGRAPYRLLAGDRACTIEGFALPPPGDQRSSRGRLRTIASDASSAPIASAPPVPNAIANARG